MRNYRNRATCWLNRIGARFRRVRWDGHTWDAFGVSSVRCVDCGATEEVL